MGKAELPRMYSKSLICCVAAMTFESCASDSRSANTLTSPELTLSSNQELDVTMVSVPSLEYTTVDLYMISSFPIIRTRLGSLSVVYPVTGPDFTLRYATVRICLPAGTYQLAFVASYVSSAMPSSAAVAEVFLSNTTCTMASPKGISKHPFIGLSFNGNNFGARFCNSKIYLYSAKVVNESGKQRSAYGTVEYQTNHSTAAYRPITKALEEL